MRRSFELAPEHAERAVLVLPGNELDGEPVDAANVVLQPGANVRLRSSGTGKAGDVGGGRSTSAHALELRSSRRERSSGQGRLPRAALGQLEGEASSSRCRNLTTRGGARRRYCRNARER